jgi:hypothetical protein
MTIPRSDPAVIRPRRRPPRPAPVLVGALVLVSAVVAWVLFRRPQLVFTNQLAGPVTVVAGEGDQVRLAPGETHTFSVPGRSSLVVQWSLERPLSANDRPMGEELRGSLVLREPSGRIERSATARGAGDYFAPLITNASDDMLRVTVNAGLEGALDCGCAVRPGARRVFIGYYRLYRNSTVRARSPSGVSATFQELGPKVTATDGTVGLRFESKDFRWSL